MPIHPDLAVMNALARTEPEPDKVALYRDTFLGDTNDEALYGPGSRSPFTS